MACGARRQLPALLHRLGHRQGVLVTDRYFTGSTPWVDEYLAATQALGMQTVVFDGGLPDPTTTLCDQATAELRARLGGTCPDHVVALGGGSNIDLAKALALTLPSGKPASSFVGDLAGCEPLPLVALPTTAGTGSEATPGAILIDPGSTTKIALMDNRLRPFIALIDPELSYTCPPRVTADAGLDAFTHAIESFLTLDSALFDRSVSVDPGYSGRSALTMMFAREAMRLCLAYLERAYRNGADHEARIGMAHASAYAALSYGSAGLNAVHGTAYAVAGHTHQSHGRTNAVMLPYVLDALREVRRAELLEVAQLMGLRADSESALVAAVPRAVRDVVARLGIPTDLQGFGIAQADVPKLTQDALSVSRLAKALPVADVPAAYQAIVNNAFLGVLNA
jgi:alcohol dehydrogenase class IV